MGVLPGRLGRVDVVLDVLDVLAALEQQDAEPFLRQLFGGPTARDPRSHHDGVVALSLHGYLSRCGLLRGPGHPILAAARRLGKGHAGLRRVGRVSIM